MALRVLLADESSTIKKVMQLALQDFGVEVKAVAVGVDVVPVARQFKPQIIFADVMLAKKSGYDVCADLKNDSEFAKVPVVLMWSSFMEIDEARASAAKADQRLEKPFDADTLRQMVKDLVPALKTNVLSNYLSFPDMPEFIESSKSPPPSQSIEVDEPDEFQQVPLPKAPRKEIPPAPPLKAEKETWSHTDLNRFKIDVAKENYGPDLTGAFELNEEGVPPSIPSVNDVPKAPPSKMAPDLPPPAPVQVSPEVMQEILREKAHEIAQELAWKMLPEIIERVVREEIQKLLEESEKLP